METKWRKCIKQEWMINFLEHFDSLSMIKAKNRHGILNDDVH